MSESKEEYKQRVLKSKKVVQQMFINGQEKKFSLTKIENDVKKYLDSQGLTKFDLRTNGDRKNQAMFQAFTNSANKGIMEILQVIVPELASSLDLKQFMLFGEEALDRNDKVKKEWEDNIEDFFTMNLIPGQRPLVDLGFTPEKLGERVADQMGESLVEFLPFMIAPNMIAANGPVQGFAQAVKMDPTKMGKVMDVLKNSYYSIINSYIKNPGKSFQADVAAAIGWGAGQQMGTEISEAADEEGTLGYYDAIKGQPLETMLGFTGATTGVIAAPAVTAAFGHPFRTSGALISGAFKNYGGIKPIVDKFQTWYKAKNKNTVQTFVDGVVNAHKDEVAAAGQIAERVAGTRTTAFEASGQQGPVQPRIISRPKLDADGNQILDKDGKPIIEKIETQPEIKLTLAEETLSPGAATEQVQIESTMVGQELDKIVKRRINNLKILDQSLETIVPSTDENFQYILDLRQGTIKPLIESLEAKIGKKSDEIAGELSTIQADLSKQESGLGLRQIIENLQISESKESLDIINNIPAGNVVFSGDTAGSAPKILEDLLSIIGLRTFEKGTEPAILKKIKSLIERYKLQDVENIRDYELPRGSDGSPLVQDTVWARMSVAEKQKWFDDNYLNPELTSTAETAKIATINQEAPVTFTNKDLYDIYLSADVELMSLIGKPGLDVTKQIMKLKLMKERILSELKTNLKDEEGGTEFIKSVNNYINKFEKGVIVRVRENKVAGYTKKDEAAADAFFNAENVQAIDDFINAFGAGGNVNQDALYNMQQAILDRLANFVIDKKTGILNQDNYRRWLAQYGSVLERLAGMDKETGMPEFIASLRETPTAIGALSERLSVLETRKTFLQGDKLKTSLKTFGINSKQLNLGSVDEYVNAALSDPKVMSNITDRIIKDGAEEVWVKSILENLTSIRTGEEGFGKGFISPKEIRDMQNWLNTNSKSLETLFEKVGYKNHLENIKAIVSGFERANFVPASKGAPALNPEQQTKAILGVNIPTLWSRIFAVQSGRVGVKYTGMEVFNRLINTVGLNHFNKLMKKAIYDPEFAKTISKAVEGGKFTINEQKQIYGFLAKLNGTIGIASEDGAEGSSVQTEADTKVIQKNKQNYEDLPDPPNIDEFQQTSNPVVQESRLSSDIINPVGMRGMPGPNAARNTASVSPDTYLKGQQLFNKPGEITFASQGGIMNARKPIQRVA